MPKCPPVAISDFKKLQDFRIDTCTRKTRRQVRSDVWHNPRSTGRPQKNPNSLLIYVSSVLPGFRCRRIFGPNGIIFYFNLSLDNSPSL